MKGSKVVRVMRNVLIHVIGIQDDANVNVDQVVVLIDRDPLVVAVQAALSVRRDEIRRQSIQVPRQIAILLQVRVSRRAH